MKCYSQYNWIEDKVSSNKNKIKVSFKNKINKEKFKMIFINNKKMNFSSNKFIYSRLCSRDNNNKYINNIKFK
jgi:hypothetical protein